VRWFAWRAIFTRPYRFRVSVNQKTTAFAVPVAVASTQTSASRLYSAVDQGLALVHFSAQLEPCLTHENTLHTINTP
jgi:hypothetical protein